MRFLSSSSVICSSNGFTTSNIILVCVGPGTMRKSWMCSLWSIPVTNAVTISFRRLRLNRLVYSHYSFGDGKRTGWKICVYIWGCLPILHGMFLQITGGAHTIIMRKGFAESSNGWKGTAFCNICYGAFSGSKKIERIFKPFFCIQLKQSFSQFFFDKICENISLDPISLLI